MSSDRELSSRGGIASGAVLFVILFGFTAQFLTPVLISTAATSTTTQNEPTASVAPWLKSLVVQPHDGSHFGVMGVFAPTQIGPAITWIYSNGAAAFYRNTSFYSSTMSTYKQTIDENAGWASSVGATYTRDAVNVYWNLVEPSHGVFNYSFPDAIVSTAEKYNLQPVLTIGPFAEWDSSTSASRISVTSTSSPLDFLLYGHYMAHPSNITAYEEFVQKLADRYDGDGVNDMPGLKYPVKYWEVWNEPTGSDLNGNSVYLNSPGNFVQLVQATRTALSRAYSGFYLLPGGAIEAPNNPTLLTQRKNFYNTFFANIGSTIDAMNFHYNTDKNFAPSWSSFSSELSYETSYQQTYSTLPKPIWLTEFGTYSGSPQAGPSTLPYQSEADQAAWLVQRFTYAFYNGVTVIPGIDIAGSTDSIGSAALVQVYGLVTSPSAYRFRVEAYTYKLMVYLVDTFTKVTQVASNQYAFTTPSGTVYVLWGSGSVSPQITGKLYVSDIYGNVAQQDASSISLSSTPILASTFNPVATTTTTSSTSTTRSSTQTTPISTTTTTTVASTSTTSQTTSTPTTSSSTSTSTTTTSTSASSSTTATSSTTTTTVSTSTSAASTATTASTSTTNTPPIPTSSTTFATSPAPTQTTTSSSSSTSPAGTGGGIPEFPFQVLAAFVSTLLLVTSYLLVRSHGAPKRGITL